MFSCCGVARLVLRRSLTAPCSGKMCMPRRAALAPTKH